jgi:hypothetical protein
MRWLSGLLHVFPYVPLAAGSTTGNCQNCCMVVPSLHYHCSGGVKKGSSLVFASACVSMEADTLWPSIIAWCEHIMTGMYAMLRSQHSWRQRQARSRHIRRYKVLDLDVQLLLCLITALSQTFPRSSPSS